MSDAFVPLDVFLSPPILQPPPTPQPLVETPPAPRSEREAAAAARRFRAALADAVDLSLQRLLPEIARAVLGRELALSPADVAAIAARALDGFEREIVGLRVHPSDVDAMVGLDIPVHADPALCRGDATLQLRAGTIDLTLQTRLDAVLTANE